jgi:hypothetical protein
MNYEVQQALGSKVDQWQFNALHQEVESLKRENHELRDKLGNAEERLRNHYSAIERLIQLLVESEHFHEIDELQSIRQYL